MRSPLAFKMPEMAIKLGRDFIGQNTWDRLGLVREHVLQGLLT